MEAMEEAIAAEDDPTVDSAMSSAPEEARNDGDQANSPHESRKEEKASNGTSNHRLNDRNNKKRKAIFQYGNYNRYYGYRVGSTLDADPRVNLMQKCWFENKDVVDVGCNEGHVTIALVQKYRVRSMCGIDIDPGLVHKAWTNLKQEAGPTEGKRVESFYEWDDYVCEDEGDYDDDGDEKPAVLESSPGNHVDGGLRGKELRERVIFKNANVLHCDLRRNIVDTVLCLSVVKWIHLNWGDEGLLEFFIKAYRVLRPGGVFVLEPQPWSSYARKCRVSEVCRRNFKTMILRPDHFPGILLDQIGFKSCEEISLEVPNSTEGFSRPLYLFTK